jgi:hypothetical protein
MNVRGCSEHQSAIAVLKAMTAVNSAAEVAGFFPLRIGCPAIARLTTVKAYPWAQPYCEEAKIQIVLLVIVKFCRPRYAAARRPVPPGRIKKMDDVTKRWVADALCRLYGSTSMRIENYLGFPTGIPGQSLRGRAFVQAQKFGAEMAIPTEVAQLQCSKSPFTLELADGSCIQASTIVVASGAHRVLSHAVHPFSRQGSKSRNSG